MMYNCKCIYYFVTIFAASFLLTVVVGNPCERDELMRCAHPLQVITAGNSELGFAAKKEELNELCPRLNAGIRCIDSYTRRCMSVETREQFNHLYSSSKMVIQDLCQEGPYQEEFLRHAPCMQHVTTNYAECTTHYTQMIQDVNNPSRNNSNSQADDEANMRMVCCSFQNYLTCTENVVKKNCGEVTAKFAQGFLDRMSSSLIKDHCRSHLPRCMDAISGALNSSALHLSNWALLLMVNLSLVISMTDRRT